MFKGLVPEDGSEQNDLLLDTSETLLQMAQIARASESNEETKVFYSHLGYHCIRLRDHARRARQALSGQIPSRIDGGLVVQTLQHFDSLVECGLQELVACTSTLQLRLGTLNLYWKEIRKQHEEAKRGFVGRCLRPGESENELLEVDKALEACADRFDKHQPEESSTTNAEKPSSLGTSQPSSAIWKAAQSVFDALVGCKECSCPGQHEFGAKLGLGTYRKPDKKAEKKPAGRSLQARQRRLRNDNDADSNLNFDLFLSMENDWHEICVQTAKEKGVTIVLPGDNIPSRIESNVVHRYAKVERLCGPISKTKATDRQRLVMKLTSGQLFEIRLEKSDSEVDKTDEGITLSRCLEERREAFTEKTQRILSLIIGYSVFYLDGTSWLQPGWDSASIKFFQTTSRKTPLRPFIQTKLPGPLLQINSAASAPDPQAFLDGTDCDHDTSDELDSLHRCPALVNLAMVLMEVYFVMPFRKLAQIRDIPLMDDPNGRLNIIDVDQVFNGIVNEDDEVVKEGWRSEIPDDNPIRAAIDNCLNGELWEDDEGNVLDSVTLRSRIYENVVHNLELYLTRGFSMISLDNVDSYARAMDLEKWGQAITSQEQDDHAALLSQGIVMPSVTPSPTVLLLDPAQIRAHTIGPEIWKTMHQESHSQSILSYSSEALGGDASHDFNYKASQFFDDEVGDRWCYSAEIQRYKAWRSDYEKVYEKFVETKIKGHMPSPVKIAILDTGIDSDHELIYGRYDNIKGKRNCYYESHGNVKDLNGHGTFAVSLILDYAPDADIYILKISDKDNARPDAAIVANAINFAVDEWNVDIVSMSFGWPSPEFDGQKILEAAIDNAYNKHVLMFAAASNSGGRLGRAYPASCPHVTCVHSTNTNGNRSDFSPTAEPEKINIATVGESVESAWPAHLCEKSDRGHVTTRSGTSYATPILAGIAAFLLQYARLHLSADQAAQLKRKDKMEALLKRCAEKGSNPTRRDGYYFVALSLHKQTLFGEELEWVKHEVLKTLQ